MGNKEIDNEKIEHNSFNAHLLAKTSTALLEVGVIMFLLYANLLMGFYISVSLGNEIDFFSVLDQLFTWKIFVIAFFSALVAYITIEILRRKR